MRGPRVVAFAEQHRLKRISVADLIAYRQAREKLVERVGEFPVQTEIGTLTGYAYVTPFDKVQHMAFVYGAHRRRQATFRRGSTAADSSATCSAAPSPVHAALRRVQGRRPRRDRLSARRRRRRADARHPADRAPTSRKLRARGSGARSGSARRS